MKLLKSNALVPVLALVVLTSLAGCGSLSPVAGARSATQTLAARARAASAPAAWSGDWVVGSGLAELAPAGPQSGCISHFHLTQDGSKFILDADDMPEAGAMPTYIHFEHAEGALVDGSLTLTGQSASSPTGHGIGMPAPQAITYKLTLDATKGHLVGTRNDQPFWAAAFKASASAACSQLQP